MAEPERVLFLCLTHTKIAQSFAFSKGGNSNLMNWIKLFSRYKTVVLLKLKDRP